MHALRGHDQPQQDARTSTWRCYWRITARCSGDAWCEQAMAGMRTVCVCALVGVGVGAGLLHNCCHPLLHATQHCRPISTGCGEGLSSVAVSDPSTTSSHTPIHHKMRASTCSWEPRAARWAGGGEACCSELSSAVCSRHSRTHTHAHTHTCTSTHLIQEHQGCPINVILLQRNGTAVGQPAGGCPCCHLGRAPSHSRHRQGTFCFQLSRHPFLKKRKI
jgi:hypothetical protein